MAKSNKTDLMGGAAVVPLAGAPPLPAELSDQTALDAGKGVSQDWGDRTIPLLGILQTNSPVCDKRGPEYIEGAEPGHIWMRGALEPIRDGVIGIVVIPCDMLNSWIEWAPNRGGFVARHDHQPSDAVANVAVTESGHNRRVLVRPSGTEVEHNREFFVLCEGAYYLLPLKSTGHKFAREWQTHFNLFRHPKTGAVLPSFSRKYRLTTKPRTNAMGRWFVFQFADEGFVSLPEYQAAKELNEIVEQGRYRIDRSAEDDVHNVGDHEAPAPSAA
jgi:hypothetical protein